MFRRLRYSLEYHFASRAIHWLETHSFDQCAARARRIARIWFALDRKRRRISIDNILKAGITTDEGEAERIAREALENFSLVAVESLKSRDVITKENWLTEIDVDIPDASMDLLKKEGQGVLLLSAHIGNWEVAARLLSFFKPVTGITRDAKNPRVNELMQKFKPSENFTLTPKHSADPTRLLSVLRKGETLALLIDQYAMSYGVQLPFFGHPTQIHKSPALFHLVTKTPIIFGLCLRTGPMKFRVEVSEPLMFPPTGNREKDIETILLDLTARTEDAIRRYPEQYLWAHNRFRTREPQPSISEAK